MAVTKIIPIRTTIGKSIAYICNPAKTENCMFTHSGHCFPETASEEFAFYERSAQSGAKIIGRHLIQSFAPGEVSPETAHEIGKKLADEILGGQYAYVMTTHVDRDHIHNHFVWCTVNLETHKRYVSNKRSYNQIQDASDRLCKEYSLSVITEPKGIGKGYKEYEAEKTGTSWKAKLKYTIDQCIPKSVDFDDFINHMKEAGYEVKYGTYISFRAVGQERYTRSKTIGEDYTEERIKERISDKKTVKSVPQHNNESGVKKLIDIENNEKIKSSRGLTHWAKLQNLRTMAGTLIVFEEQFGMSMEKFEAAYNECCEKCDETKAAYDKTTAMIASVQSKKPTPESAEKLKRLKAIQNRQSKEHSALFHGRWDFMSMKSNLDSMLRKDKKRTVSKDISL